MSRNVAAMPISTAMHRPDRFDDGPDPSELPDLPIPRPGEGPSERAAQPPPIAAPRLGGGASFTSVGEEDPPATTPPAAPSRSTAPDDDTQLIEVDRARLDTERFTWEVAARLTAGMLSNPERNHSSVKDAMAMFDQFLHELHAYSRIASEYDVTGDQDRRRRDHSEYFRDLNERLAAAELRRQTTPVPTQEQLHLAQQQAQQQAQQAEARPEPTQPAPAAGYQALPPGARGMYIPGSMAGAPPDPSGDVEEDVA
jgi:hypothetical protein